MGRSGRSNWLGNSTLTGCCDEGFAASGSDSRGDMLINRINVKKITRVIT
jgi:hypothetical protein